MKKNLNYFIFGFIVTAIAVIVVLKLTGTSSNFFMKNNLQCRVTKASDWHDMLQTISLIDLETDSPRVLFSDGVTAPMKKISDRDNILVIQQVADWTGSTDTVTIFKTTGKFEREAKG